MVFFLGSRRKLAIGPRVLKFVLISYPWLILSDVRVMCGITDVVLLDTGYHGGGSVI